VRTKISKCYFIHYSHPYVQREIHLPLHNNRNKIIQNYTTFLKAGQAANRYLKIHKNFLPHLFRFIHRHWSNAKLTTAVYRSS